MDYNFSADLLNKFSQFTPWVQAILGLGLWFVFLGFFFSLVAIVRIVCASRGAKP